MTFKTVFFIMISIMMFEVFPWPINMILAFILISKHTQNFVIKPIARWLSINNRTPENYVFRKMKNIREVIWFFAIFMELEIVFILEIVAIGASCKIINNIKSKMGISTSVFSKEDYTIYDEYLRYSEDNPPLVEDAFYEELNDDYKIVKEFSYTKPNKENNVIAEQVDFFKQKIEEKLKKSDNDVEDTIVDALEESIEEIEEKFTKEIEIPKVDMSLFNKPIEDVKTDFSLNTKPIEPQVELPKVQPKSIETKIEPTPIETISKFDFNKPIGDISISSNTSTFETPSIEIKEDEITCEKCGTVMSKNKIACPKCGALVKYKPNR